MNIELLCRFNVDPDDATMDEINEKLNTEELIQGDRFNKNKEYLKLVKQHKLYDYTPLTFNLRDVRFINPVDNEHTTLRFFDGSMYTFKINYTNFKTIYQTLLATMIHDNKSISFDKPSE